MGYYDAWREKIKLLDVPTDETGTHKFWSNKRIKPLSVKYQTQDLLRDAFLMSFSVIPETMDMSFPDFVTFSRLPECDLDESLPDRLIGNIMVYSLGHYSANHLENGKFQKKRVAQEGDQLGRLRLDPEICNKFQGALLPYLLLYRLEQWPGASGYLKHAKKSLESFGHFLTCPWKQLPSFEVSHVNPFDKKEREEFVKEHWSIAYTPYQDEAKTDWETLDVKFQLDYYPFLMTLAILEEEREEKKRQENEESETSEQGESNNDESNEEPSEEQESAAQEIEGLPDSPLDREDGQRLLEALQEIPGTTVEETRLLFNDSKVEKKFFIALDKNNEDSPVLYKRHEKTDCHHKNLSVAKRLSSILQLHANSVEVKTRELKKGKLDTKNLWKASFNERLFYQKYEEPSNYLKVLFLLDRSGSMSGSSISVQKAMWPILKAFELSPFIDYKCYSYSSGFPPGRSDSIDWRTPGSFGPTQILCEHTTETIGGYYPTGANKDAEVFESVSHLIRFDGTVNFFFVLSDSLPNGKNAVDRCSRIISSLRKRGVICKHFAVSGYYNKKNSEKIYGRGNSIEIKDNESLFPQLKGTFLSALREAERKQELLR